MKQLTIKDIRDLDPCYDPGRHISEDWRGTVIDILKLDGPSHEDKIWVVTHLIDDKTNRLFAGWCAREALKLAKDPDQRSIEACNVAERFANGQATKEELAAAWSAAWYAAASAAESAAESAAWTKIILYGIKLIGG